ncbi:MAG: hypothetical protein Fur0014_15100 [Rubrivivax sp.]
MSRSALAAAALALLTAGSAQAIGRAEVNFVQPERFADAGFGSLERERNLRLVADHFDRLARRLPDGHVLKVEVTELDLAGEVDTLSLHRIRVMGQLPDAPRMALKFELLKDGQVLAAGEDRLIDMSYPMSRAGGRDAGPLPYEARMLERWFDERLAAVR